MTWRLVLATGLAGFALAGCGGDDESSSDDGAGSDPAQEAAADPSASAFPSADGKSLRDLTKGVSPGINFAPATMTYTPGKNRVGFGLIDQGGQFVYAPTAVYVAQTPGSPAEGPFLAPADTLVTDEAYRSKTAALESDPIASVYAAEVPLPKPGPWSALVLSDTGDGLLGATAQLKVKAQGDIPAVGDAAPEVHTDTVSDVGDISKIDTRIPPDSMHDVDFADAVGQRPVALLFATPALCQSRVCGPVTDIAEQLKTDYGDDMDFIHEEVYVDNDPNKGLRPPLEAFNLHSEPWLFVIGADGRIAARLEGSFGVNAFESAVQQGLR